ncbi:pitrilysin family protein [Mesonia ostreae]|uniref:Pitrilysin family protein n=1 Tax=Mesonia ostreae TaxID=861110 RepID=A0ABU2KKQ1_9FLAO|nr:pitrilysin family protein [Mesonia ostreae]MDT0295264.1 pitrilysin family protein [Mesonia ostreae]
MKFKLYPLFIMCLMVFGAQAQVDRSKQPQPGPAPKINLNKPASFKLDNGLKVMVVENHKLPRVSASLIIDNKPNSEGNKEGVKALYSAMMGTGTNSMSKDDFNERIDFLGANVNYSTQGASARSLSKFFPEVLELMAQGLLDPKFDAEEFETQKDRLIEGIKSNAKSAGVIASNVSQALAYGKNHPYGEFATEASAEKVTLADVNKYYENYISPKNAYLVVVGDIKERDVKKLVRKLFSDWQADVPPSGSLPSLPKVQYTQINFVDVPNAVQSELYVQNTIDLKMADEDYFPVLVTNQILGGSFGSYLNMNLREKNGYTYGARTSTGDDKYASRFYASASVRNAVTDSAIVETFKEIKRIKSEKVSYEDLSNAKNKFAGDFVLRLERPSTIASYALNIETENLPSDFYTQFLKKINAVTQEDIMRVANKYYKTDKMQIVVAGKGAEVLTNLENVKIDGKKTPIFFFNKEGEKVERPVYTKEVPEGVSVKTVYEDYIKAVGGEKATKAVKSIVSTGSASVQGMNLSYSSKNTADGKSLTLVQMNGMTLSKQVFDGETGYTEAQGQRMDYTEDQIIAAKRDAKLFTELEASASDKLTGIEVVDGEDAYVIETSKDSKNYYSTKTGLKLQTVTTVSQGDQSMTTTMGYDDYKTVEGVKLPHLISINMGPQTIEVSMNQVELNKGVSDADFK